MENEAITEEPLTVEITQYCDVNKLEIVQESLNMGQIAPGGDKEGNSRLFSQPSQSRSGCWTMAGGEHSLFPSRKNRDISLSVSQSVLKYQAWFVGLT